MRRPANGFSSVLRNVAALLCVAFIGSAIGSYISLRVAWSELAGEVKGLRGEVTTIREQVVKLTDRMDAKERR